MDVIQDLMKLTAPQPKNGIAGGTPQDFQDRFLKLLVTQMKNQDPLNPMDNAQVTTQMAQISTVSGIEKLNATFESLRGQMTAAQAISAADMIGHGVLVPGAGLSLQNGEARFGAQLEQPAEKVSVTVQDASGRVLYRSELGAQPAGTLSLAWDGVTENGSRAADGQYQFTVSAQSGKTAVATQPLTYGRVNGVTPGAQGVTLQLDRAGSVPLADVRQIF